MEVNIILRVQTWRLQFDPRIYIRVYRENHSANCPLTSTLTLAACTHASICMHAIIINTA